MPLTPIERHLLDAVKNMENAMTLRALSLEERMTTITRRQNELAMELQTTHDLVSELERLLIEFENNSPR